MDDKIRTIKEIPVNIYDIVLTKILPTGKKQNVLTFFYLYMEVQILNC